MNREILFKAKRKNWRELPKEEWWVDGLPQKMWGEWHIIPTDDENTAYSIDTETISQYIGKNDKNKKWIYENDIISINTYSYMEPEEDYFGQVVYSEGWSCWCIQQPDDEKPIPLCECEGSYQTDIFVYGNAFDNPELMSGQAIDENLEEMEDEEN